jgi:alpha-beta hydrolase superfamily lysophospholipase
MATSSRLQGTFKSKEGTQLFYQGWLPSFEPQTVLVLVHGLAEHSSRYNNLADEMTSHGFAVYAMDLRGHGRSAGKRCYVKHFSDYVDDLDIFIDLVRSKHPAAKIFLLGHSLGGTIATFYAAGHQEKLAGMILSAPTLKLNNDVSKRDKFLALILSRFVPHLGISRLEASFISQDPAVVKAYTRDPLVYTGKISARMGVELMWTIEETVPGVLPSISLPVLIMQGTEDRLSHPDSGKFMYNSISSKDKTLKCYEGLFHEIFNEPRHALVFADMRQWLDERI